MQNSQILNLDGDIKLCVLEKGVGVPLVFIPGLSFSMDVFTAQLDAFADSYRVILIDPRSQGNSPVTQTGNNYQQHGRDLAALFDYLQLEDIVLIGWSFACHAVWRYVEQAGMDRLRAFINIDQPLVPLAANEAEHDWRDLTLAELPDAYEAMSSQQGFRALMTDYLHHVMVERGLSEKESANLLADSFKVPAEVIVSLFASGICSNNIKIAQQMAAQIPNMCFLSHHSAETAPAYLQKHCPQIRTEVLGGHMMFWEYSDKFNALLADFLATNAG